ncbi:hypothetical protein T12_11492 [Trichinella patagoniensis]|uniref:Uncharacterized protein n=1 Tax=Trichinella patagoniensis TaxID=990121 RepID=A0A0V1AEY4_9BILA|nr:hypothetical protein T12_11492 [Trichinella patagoniensis]
MVPRYWFSYQTFHGIIIQWESDFLTSNLNAQAKIPPTMMSGEDFVLAERTLSMDVSYIHDCTSMVSTAFYHLCLCVSKLMPLFMYSDLILQVKLPNHIMKPTLRKQIKSTLYFLTPSDDN